MSSLDDKIENIEHILRDLSAFRYGDKVFMTGQEWYDRFYKELSADDINLDYEEDVLETPQVLLAARRAAGIEDA